ncbi:Protein of unknown function DUF594 [Dillenia turbinata]|uniref:DUF4220 domain-containing protein n=1 Tax=Dillenia turbinata TaxID=194707 RepID=A0AAN8UIH9_9MAGN
MQLPIPDEAKKLWDTWNLRSFILMSLTLQAVLIFFAPLRKRTSNQIVLMMIWSAYLLADWVAAFAVGLISNSQGDSTGEDVTGDLLAFWAPFLLLHLGGPDTITALALEDNELWLRHLLGLIVQVLAALYVLFQTLPNNKFGIPAIFMFIAGTIKYAERTRALYLASLESFRDSMLGEPDPGPNYAKLMAEYYSKKVARLPTRIDLKAEPEKAATMANIEVVTGGLEDADVIRHAYRYFEIFKGLIVDLIFSFNERNESQQFFLKRNAADAFRVVEVELNFIYEVLYTKIVVVHCLVGYILRTICFLSLLVALIFFIFIPKKGLHQIEIGITYTLLLVALALDTIAFFMLLFSDWTVPSLKNSEKKFPKATKLLKFLILKKPRWLDQFPHPYPKHVRMVAVLFRRWSESMSQYNLISYCLNERSTKLDAVFDYVGLKDILDQMKHMSKSPFTKELRDFIFNELHRKSTIADDDAELSREICSAKGDWILRDIGYPSLLPWVEGVEYDESLILWHIATELCYSTDEHHDKPNDGRKFSKIFSDYMLYLLIMQPTMMSAVAGIGQIRFRDTCAEAQKFFRRREKMKDKDLKQTCEKILEVCTDVRPSHIKGDRSKSVFFDACILAKELKQMKGRQWEIMSLVWLEMLCYAATHCRANAHAQQLCKGGELISLVWLLMAHFGLGDQFRIKEGHLRAKLIVGK